MSVRRPTARTTTPDFVTCKVNDIKFSLSAPKMLHFKSGTLFSDDYDKSELYSLCKKIAKIVLGTNLPYRYFTVFKQDKIWYEKYNYVFKNETYILPALEEQDFYKKLITI